MENSCVTCSNEVGVEDKALMCDLCEKWEHVECIRLSDRPTEALYAELVRCRTRSLIFTCTKCRTKGSVVKRLVESEYQCARATDERLASARQLELAHKQIAALDIELKQLRAERDELRVQGYRGRTDIKYETPSRQRQSMNATGPESTVHSRPVVSPLLMPELVTEQSSEESSDVEERQLPTPRRTKGGATVRPHPPGFKEIHTGLRSSVETKGQTSTGGLKTLRRHPQIVPGMTQ